MKKFKDKNNQLHVIDEAFTHLLPADCVQITDEEAEVIRLSQAPIQEDIVSPTASELMAQLQAIQLQIEALEAN